MIGYTLVAQGDKLSNLQSIVGDMALPSGTKLRLEADIISQNMPGGYISPAIIFNVAGMENIFRPYMPASIILDDVRAEGTTLVVEMHATSPFLVPVIAFIAANWLSISITVGLIGFALFTLIGGVELGVNLPAVVGQTITTAGNVVTGTASTVVKEAVANPMSTGIIVIMIVIAILIYQFARK